MVQILANGDIVQDDDPRAQKARRPQSGANIRSLGSTSSSNQGSRGGYGGFGGVNHDNGADGNQAPEGQGQQVSIFEILNQKLLGLGIPRMNLWGNVIEPIVTVGFILAMLLFGLPGLIFGALLFGVVKLSQGRQQNPQPQRRHYLRRR